MSAHLAPGAVRGLNRSTLLSLYGDEALPYATGVRRFDSITRHPAVRDLSLLERLRQVCNTVGNYHADLVDAGLDPDQDPFLQGACEAYLEYEAQVFKTLGLDGLGDDLLS